MKRCSEIVSVSQLPQWCPLQVSSGSGSQHGADWPEIAAGCSQMATLWIMTISVREPDRAAGTVKVLSHKMQHTFFSNCSLEKVTMAELKS